MAKIYYDKDVKLDVLKGKKIAVIGYGSQGRHQALNMKDSGFDVIIGQREGKSADDARKDGFEVVSAVDAAKKGDLIILTVPDELHESIYNEIKSNITEGKALGVCHGFSILYGLINPPENIDVVMIAPKAPGPTVRSTYVGGSGVPSAIAVYQDYTGKALQKALAWGHAIGSGRVGIIETTFAEEVETDLFGEITVLCGGVAELIKAGFETLVDAGYQPEIAYFECCNELKLIVDLIYNGGLENMWYSVSNTAEYGGRIYGKEIIDDSVKENMRDMIDFIRSGRYGRDVILEQRTNMNQLKRYRELEKDELIEVVGKKLRGMMKRGKE
ncbi:MAG TPA: ketol-acid reductoisomerase [Halobacteria archaeon]|nr:ketol-acid reductoisomerase [Halobacteria archaeon]